MLHRTLERTSTGLQKTKIKATFRPSIQCDGGKGDAPPLLLKASQEPLHGYERHPMEEVADVRKAQQRLDRLDEALIMATEGQALSWTALERESSWRGWGERATVVHRGALGSVTPQAGGVTSAGPRRNI